MAVSTLKCNHLMPLHFKGLTASLVTVELPGCLFRSVKLTILWATVHCVIRSSVSSKIITQLLNCAIFGTILNDTRYCTVSEQKPSFLILTAFCVNIKQLILLVVSTVEVKAVFIVLSNDAVACS